MQSGGLPSMVHCEVRPRMYVSYAGEERKSTASRTYMSSSYSPPRDSSPGPTMADSRYLTTFLLYHFFSSLVYLKRSNRHWKLKFSHSKKLIPAKKYGTPSFVKLSSCEREKKIEKRNFYLRKLLPRKLKKCIFYPIVLYIPGLCMVIVHPTKLSPCSLNFPAARSYQRQLIALIRGKETMSLARY